VCPLTKTNYLLLKWDDVKKLAEKVADKIIESSYKPDIIIAISRGGFDHARILSDELDIQKLASFQMVYYKSIEKRHNIPQVINPLKINLKGLKALLVDDVSDSGNSLTYAKQHVLRLEPQEIKIATLHHKPWSNYEADYYAEIVDQWVIYPWEMRESILQISKELRSKGLNDKTINERLRKIGFKDHHLKRYLDIKEM
jgi:hypoxanthine phosphoribosyltransferase